jgi:hypothetical protein
VSNHDDYELVLTPPARRALTEKLPEPVAAAVIEFITTSLVGQPRTGPASHCAMTWPECGQHAAARTGCSTASAKTPAR